MKRFLGGIALNVLVALAATVVALLCGEAGLRLFLPQKLYRFAGGLYRNDPDRVYSLAPGFRGTLRNPEYTTHVRVNALGLRGGEVGPKAPGTLRVLGLGDSFASAFNVEEPETFLSVLELGLHESLGGRPVEVMNAGSPGYGTWHELQTLKKLAPLLSPDAVVLCVYVGNDLEDNLAPRAAAVRNGYLVQRKASAGILPLSLRSWLQRNSMTYVFVWSAWQQIRPLLGRGEYDPMAHSRGLVSRLAPGSIEEGYRVTKDLLREVAETASARRMSVLAVLVPMEFQVYPERFDVMVRRGRQASEFDLDLPNRRWSELARQVGLPAVDLLPIFRARKSGPYLYMSLDGHLTREGNQLAGTAIRDALLPLLRASAREGA